MFVSWLVIKIEVREQFMGITGERDFRTKLKTRYFLIAVIL